MQMSDFAAELARLMAARSLGVRELARMVPCNPGHVSTWLPQLAGCLVCVPA
jgi:hypothetical protein